MAETISSVSVRLDADTVAYIRSLKDAQTQTNRRLKAMQDDFGRFSSSAGVAGAGVALAVFTTEVVQALNALGELGIETVAAQRDIERLAARTGLATEEVLGIQAALVGTGIDFENYGDIIKDVDDKLGDFILTGGGEAVDAMEFLEKATGKSAQALADLGGKDFLGLLQTEMDKANLSTQQQTFLLESLGNDAVRLQPILRKTAKEQQRLNERWGDAAIVLDDEVKDSIDEYERQSKLLSSNIDTFTTKTLEPFISKWGDLKEAIAGALSDAVTFRDNEARLAEWESNYGDSLDSARENVARTRRELEQFNNATYGTPDPIQLAKLEEDVKAAEETLTRLIQFRNDFILGNTPDNSGSTESDTGSATGGGTNETSQNFGDLYGGQTNVTDTANYKNYVELEDLKTQYLADAVAIRDQLYIDSGDTLLERLEREKEIEIRNLDERLEGTLAYEQKKAAIEAKYRQDKERLDKLAEEREISGNLRAIDSVGNALGYQFNLEKSYAVSKALLHEQTGLAAAWSKPFPENLWESALVLAEHGVIQGAINAINFSQAHGGLDSVPATMDNSTFMLSAGERIIAPDQNVELGKFLEAQKESGYKGGDTIINQTSTFNNGGKDFENMVLKTVNDNSKLIAAAVQKGEKLRPTRRR